MHWKKVQDRPNWTLRNDEGHYLACIAGDILSDEMPKDAVYRLILIHAEKGFSIAFPECYWREDELEEAKRDVERAFKDA